MYCISICHADSNLLQSLNYNLRRSLDSFDVLLSKCFNSEPFFGSNHYFAEVDSHPPRASISTVFESSKTKQGPRLKHIDSQPRCHFISFYVSFSSINNLCRNKIVPLWRKWPPDKGKQAITCMCDGHKFVDTLYKSRNSTIQTCTGTFSPLAPPEYCIQPRSTTDRTGHFLWRSCCTIFQTCLKFPASDSDCSSLAIGQYRPACLLLS